MKDEFIRTFKPEGFGDYLQLTIPIVSLGWAIYQPSIERIVICLLLVLVYVCGKRLDRAFTGWTEAINLVQELTEYIRKSEGRPKNEQSPD